MMLRTLFLFLLIFISTLRANTASTECIAITDEVAASVSDKEILEIFYRTLFKESQGGYVLFGSKPVCVEGILLKETNLIMLGGDLHKTNVILKEGLKIWQKLPRKSQKYYIHLYEKGGRGWRDIVLINREAFINVVKENLPLFQYVLGPGVSPEGLFTQLIDPEESFDSVFQNNRVLIGIVLGFGTQNALYGSREENIGDTLAKKEKIPFKPLNLRLEETRKKGCLDYKSKEASPSFGYSSLRDELDHLDKSTFVSKELVDKSPPLIPW